MTIIGVYGSLRKLGQAHHLVKDSEFLGEDEIFGKLYGTMAFFPAVKLLESHAHLYDCHSSGQMPFCDFVKLPTVKIELYRVSTDTLEDTQRYEGFYPKDPDTSLFVPRETRTAAGISCIVYEANFVVDDKLHIRQGDWFHTMG